ncbi:Outer membrane porin F precursor [compost metagenome]
MRDYLIRAGISPDRLTAQGYEANVPLVSNDTEEGRRKNRRIELRIIRVAP